MVATHRPALSDNVGLFYSPCCHTQGLICFSCPFVSLVGIPHAHQHLSCRARMLVSGVSITLTTTSTTGDAFVSRSDDNDQRFTVLFTLRVSALYRGVRWARWPLWFSFVLFHGLRSGLLLFGDIVIYGEFTHNQEYQCTDFIVCREHDLLS